MKIIFILVLLSSIAFSQSEHIYTKSLGLGARYNYASSGEFSGNGVSAGLSIFGNVDLAVEHMISYADVEYSSQDVDLSSTLVYLAYNVKPKGKSNMKFMLGLMNTSINRNSLSGFMFGLLFSLKVLDNEILMILPGLGLTYGFISLPSNGYGYNNSAWLDTRSLGLEINFDFKVSKNITVIFTPSLSKDLLDSSGPTTTGLSIGLLLTTIAKDVIDE